MSLSKEETDKIIKLSTMWDEMYEKNKTLNRPTKIGKEDFINQHLKSGLL
jgi:hypothetical protein